MPRLATREELPQLTEVLVAAFWNYPWTRWAIPEGQYADRLRELQRIYLEHFALPHGMVWVNDQLTAVAAFVPALMPDSCAGIYRRITELHGYRFTTVKETEDLLSRKRPHHDWLLAAAGVEPQHQGQGLGSGVIGAGLKHIGALGQICLTETSDFRNVSLYQKLGFHLAEAVSTKGPRTWLMATSSSRLTPSHVPTAPAGSPEPVIRQARREDLVKIQDIEIAAGETFRTLGTAAIAEDSPPSLKRSRNVSEQRKSLGRHRLP